MSEDKFPTQYCSECGTALEPGLDDCVMQDGRGYIFCAECAPTDARCLTHEGCNDSFPDPVYAAGYAYACGYRD